MLAPTGPDPKSEVFEGRAGTGAAVILPDAWKFPLQLGNQYAHEDGLAAQHAAALRAKQLAEQKKANDKALADLTNIDTSKAWDIDQPAIRDKYQALIQYAAQSEAQGKPVGDSRNTEQWAKAQSLRKDIADAASASTQQQAKWSDIGKAVLADKDGAYDADRAAADLAAYKATPYAERVGLDIGLHHYFNPGKAMAAIHDKVDQVKTTNESFTGRENTTRTVTDQAYNNQQHALMAQELLKMPGAADYVAAEYKKLTPEQRALPGNRSLDTYAQNWAETQSRQMEAKKHEVKLDYAAQWHGFAPHAKSAAELENENKKIGATTAVNQAVQLMSGDPSLFTKHSADHPGLFEAALGDKVPAGKFSYVTRDKQGQEVQHTADNFIERSFLDPATGKVSILTTEALRNGTGPVEVNEANGLRSLIYPLAGGKDQGIVNQVLAEQKLYGPNGLDLSRVRGASISPSQVQARQQAAQQYKAQTQAAHTQLQKLAPALEDKSTWTTTGGSPRPAAAKQVNQVLATGTLHYQGKDLPEPHLEVNDKDGLLYGYKAGALRLRYKGDDGTGLVVKPADLPALLKGFRVTPPAVEGAPAPVGSPTGTANVSTVVTSKKTSKKSNSSESATPSVEAAPHLKKKFQW